MNKKEMLKIAGVTSEREFYKLYKTEEDFMKVHKKSFKKAMLGEKIKKAQQGTTQGAYNQQNAGMNTLATTDADVQGAISNLSTGTPKKTTGNIIEDVTSDIPILGSLVSGIVGLFDAGAERKRQVRAGALSNVQLQAQKSAPRQQNRKYNRPDLDANVADINSLMPAEGTGTNLLAKNGGEIANTFAPNDIYSDGGYEPIANRMKQYYNGGDIPQADWGAILSSVLSSKSGSSGGSSGGGGIMGLIGGLLGGGGETTTPTTTLDPSQFVMRNNFSPTYVRAKDGSLIPKAQVGINAINNGMDWITKLKNTSNNAIIGSSANTGLAKMLPIEQATKDAINNPQTPKTTTPETTSWLKNPTTANNIEQGAKAVGTGFDAIPAFNTKMSSSVGKIGEAVGSVIPIPGASKVLKLVGQGIGAIVEPKEGMKSLLNQQRNLNQMASTQAANVLHSNHSGNMRTGGNLRQNDSPDMEQNGELNTLWGGHAEPISYNPYLPDGGETVMFRGKSHEEGNNGRTGIGVQYGEGGDLQPYDANVEVEGGELAVQMPDEQGEKNLVVFGNLPIPNQFVSLLGDDKAKGKKFKNYVALLSKDENKQNKIIEKAMKKMKELDPKTPHEKIEWDSAAMMFKAGNQNLLADANKKKNAADLQELINYEAESRGIDADALARGSIKAMKGATVSMAENGKKIKKSEVQSYIDKGYKQDPKNPHRYVKAGSPAVTTEGTPGKEAVTKTTPGVKRTPVMTQAWIDASPEERKRMSAEQDAKWLKNPASQPTTQIITPAVDPIPPSTKDAIPPDEVYYEEIPTPEEKKQPQFFNPLGNYLPSNKEELDPRQLTGEYFALATNQLEPVPAQQYHPTLKTPYEISLQDILNENTAATRGAQRFMGYNPAAQSNLLAQQYGANAKVLGDQFRINQEMKNKVYDENISTLNDAQLKNLAIMDTQYQRQAKALSNTKDVAREALSSISDKYLQNDLINKKNAILQNTYNSRYDDRGHAWNMNQPANFNMTGRNGAILKAMKNL